MSDDRTPTARLSDLLDTLFDVDEGELRRFLESYTDYEEIVRSVNWGKDRATVAFDAAKELHQERFVDAEFRERLIAEKPRFQPDIDGALGLTVETGPEAAASPQAAVEPAAPAGAGASADPTTASPAPPEPVAVEQPMPAEAESSSVAPSPPMDEPAPSRAEPPAQAGGGGPAVSAVSPAAPVPRQGEGTRAWFELTKLDFSDSSTRRIKEMLKEAYGPDFLREVVTSAGIDAGDINFNKPPNLLPEEVMVVAARQNRMTQLLAEVLVDTSVAAIHDDLWRLLGPDAERVHAAALATRANFDRLAVLPGPSTYAVNGVEGDLQTVVRALAKFNDSALFRYEIAKREARVVRIDVSAGGSSGSEWSGRGLGTGWLVGPDLVLTNNHVVKGSTGDWGAVTVLLDHKVVPGLDGVKLDPGRRVGLADNPLLAHSGDAGKEVELSEGGADASFLDFALLRLAEPVGSQGLGPNGQGEEERGWFPLPSNPHDFQVDEGLFILGHPQLQGDTEAGPLKFTFALPSEVRLTQNGCRVRYSVNTEGGSSGSPVMDQDFNPLALHNAGRPGRPDWDTAGHWPDGFNQGIPLHLIVAAIREGAPPEVAAALGIR